MTQDAAPAAYQPAVPDEYWGEQVAAFVRTAPGGHVTQEELRSYCRARPAAHKTPRHWVFVDAFPLTPVPDVTRPGRPARPGSSGADHAVVVRGRVGLPPASQAGVRVPGRPRYPSALTNY